MFKPLRRACLFELTLYTLRAQDHGRLVKRLDTTRILQEPGGHTWVPLADELDAPAPRLEVIRLWASWAVQRWSANLPTNATSPSTDWC